MFGWLWGNFKKDIEHVAEETVQDYFKSKEFNNLFLEALAVNYEKLAQEPRYIKVKLKLLENVRKARSMMEEV